MSPVARDLPGGKVRRRGNDDREPAREEGKSAGPPTFRSAALTLSKEPAQHPPGTSSPGRSPRTAGFADAPTARPTPRLAGFAGSQRQARDALESWVQTVPALQGQDHALPALGVGTEPQRVVGHEHEL